VKQSPRCRWQLHSAQSASQVPHRTRSSTSTARQGIALNIAHAWPFQGARLLKQSDTHMFTPTLKSASCLPCLAGASQGEQLRIQLGRSIRQLKANWRLAVLLVPLLQLPAATPLGVEPGTSDTAADTPAAGSSGREEGTEGSSSMGVLQQQEAAVQLLLSAAKGFGLEDCWQWKPLLDGKQVSMALLETYHAKPLSRWHAKPPSPFTPRVRQGVDPSP
jgi:hypothetical protein